MRIGLVTPTLVCAWVCVREYRATHPRVMVCPVVVVRGVWEWGVWAATHTQGEIVRGGLIAHTQQCVCVCV